MPNGPTAYHQLMDRLLACKTEHALREIVPAIQLYLAMDRNARFDFGESWMQQWTFYVGTPVPEGLWPPSGGRA